MKGAFLVSHWSERIQIQFWILTLKLGTIGLALSNFSGPVLPTTHNDINVLGIEFHQERRSTLLFCCDQSRAGSAERIEHHVTRLAGIANGTFHQFDRFHGRVQIVLVWLFDLPHIALITVSAPVMLASLGPAVKEMLVLALVVRTPHGEGVLGPDNESRPLATGFAKRCLQHIHLTGCLPREITH